MLLSFGCEAYVRGAKPKIIWFFLQPSISLFILFLETLVFPFYLYSKEIMIMYYITNVSCFWTLQRIYSSKNNASKVFDVYEDIFTLRQR